MTNRAIASCCALSALLWSGWCQSQNAATLPAAYLRALEAARIPASSAAVVITPLDAPSGPRVSWNERTPMNPASTMKLVTTYAALNVLGPQFTWRTDALATGPVQRGVLTGDLAFRGSGDPKIVIEQLWLLAYRIRAYGIREIQGDIWLDKSAFAPIEHDPNEFDGEGSRAYNVGPDALLVNFKAIAFHFVPDETTQTARVVVVPEIAGMTAPPAVPAASGSCGDWRSKLRADFANPYAPRFSGNYPLACGERVWYLSALEHSEYFEAVFRALWTAQGGVWRGRLREGPVPASARVIASHESPPLALAIRDVNKFSNNVMARHLFLAMGMQTSGAPPQPASTLRGASAARAWLAAQGLDSPDLVLDNGSGLSRRERISAATMARLLAHAYRNAYSAEFVASLPISGIDGTLKDRDIVRGAAHLKTGLLQDSRALAGYVTSRSGRRYLLVALLNHANANSGWAERAQNTLVNWLYEAG